MSTKPQKDDADAEADSAARVARWLADTGLLDAPHQALVWRLREAVLSLSPDITEEVKYGGLLFSCPKPFCGVYSYRAHVSLEFSQGAALPDAMNLLEGRGKLRRHLKLRSLDDLRSLQVSHYLTLAHRAAQTR